MIRKLHLPHTTIVDLAEGRLAAAESVAASEHLQSCDRCAAEYHAVADLVNLMRTDVSEDAPRDVVAQVTVLFRGQARHPEPRPSILRRIIAAVGFDSAQLQPQLGLRSASPGVRQILYSADEFDLDLHLHPAGTSWTVAGQILGPCSEGEVELYSTGQRVKVPLNSLCEFSLDRVPPGMYTLVLHLPDTDLEVHALAIGSTHESG